MGILVMTLGILMMSGGRAVNGAGVHFRPDDGQSEHQREQHPDEPHHTILSFQRPRRNNTALATAKVENAIATAQATPCGPILKWRARM